MDLAAQKILVRQFYEENYLNLSDAVWSNKIESFFSSLEIIASVKIGKLSPLEVRVQKINQNVPQSISDSFSRHLWYSQWNFANLFLVKTPIDGQNFFFLFHSGIIDDAWENDTQVFEIFTEKGEFLGATDLCNNTAVKWSEKMFTNTDFRDGRTANSPPLWNGDTSDAAKQDALWSEEMLRREGGEIAEEGTVTRYFFSW